MKYASIDIGTNAVLMLIVEIDKNNGISDILDLSTITRLGEGLKEKGQLDSKAMARTFSALEKYRKIINENNVSKVVCLGTSALREAENSAFFLKTVKKKLDFSIEVISEEKEAYYTYLSVKYDKTIKEDDFIIIDIGGGSTEIIIGNNNDLFNFVSLPVGSVKLTEMFVKQNLPLEDELFLLEEHVKNLLKRIPFDGRKKPLIGTAGTITTLACIVLGLDIFVKEKIHGLKISLLKINMVIDSIRKIEISHRNSIKGMEQGREDILLQGIILLREIMLYFGADHVTVSVQGGRYGVLHDRLAL